MTKRVLGRATYKAWRSGGLLHLSAKGETRHFNDKVDFEQLPFLIFPPMFGFFFIEPGIGLPAIRKFVHEESFVFPKSATVVRIQDADGTHNVPITDISMPELTQLDIPPSEDGYCVFAWTGINSMMIAKCDANVPAVYTRVFGPDTYAKCKKYIQDNGGI